MTFNDIPIKAEENNKHVKNNENINNSKRKKKK